ncbi:hypothetical protein BLNAU_6612 [Blattamonas nauphoetae]|uniref:Cyclin N-terminal domain-containing protein n=1 Tax=Blattamonas nauphoetae TaxID=2049346 RepID=A0ABQ9Y3K9_9EUKA|nr:hypothetical protein BLNAU_6612 [Blattamonas nauphoetae]
MATPNYAVHAPQSFIPKPCIRTPQQLNSTPLSQRIPAITPNSSSSSLSISSPNDKRTPITKIDEYALDVTQDLLDTISDHIVQLFLDITDDAEIQPKSEMITKTRNLLNLVNRNIRFSTGEILYACFLIERVLRTELDDVRDPPYPIARPGNWGTIVLCGIVLALKMQRDGGYKSHYWKRLLGVQPESLLQSELILLSRLRFVVFVGREELEEYETLTIRSGSVQLDDY